MPDETFLAIDNIQKESSRLNVQLTHDQSKQLSTYAHLLIEYNQHTNLVGNDSPQCLLQEHILDSLALIPIIRDCFKNKQSWQASLIDIGSGAGFPGIVLAIALPNIEVTTVDSSGKKVAFLDSVLTALAITNRARAIKGRAEEIAHKKTFRSSFDLATCRAVGALPLVCELTLPFLKPGAWALLQRGSKNIESEKSLALSLASQFGSSLAQSILLDREVLDKDHYVLLFRQEKPTMFKFPRKWKDIIA